MNGPEIFNFTIKIASPCLEQLLAKSGFSLDAVDYFIFHQANKFMLDHLRKKLRIPAHKFCICLEECGNTVSSTIPISLEWATGSSQISAGSRIVLLGFGVGFSWAAAMVEIV
jgi:3-oxoacyl-[acyl-carrier-protein] synthase-3